jgi:hypothetical protein
MRAGSIFWGTLIILVGLAFLLGTLFAVNVWPFLLPAVVIFVGVWILIGSQLRPQAVASQDVVIPLQGAARADLRLRHGAGRLQLREGAGSGSLVEGSFTGGVRHREHREGDTLDAELSVPEEIWMNFGGPWFFGPWTPITWDVRVNKDIPLTLDLETGAGESHIDLSALRVEDVRLKTGASSTEMTLPARAGRSRVKVQSGAASVVLHIPDGVAAHIEVESGLAGISIDPNRFPRSGSVYESTDYAQAQNKLDIRIETGVGAVEIR